MLIQKVLMLKIHHSFYHVYEVILITSLSKENKYMLCFWKMYFAKKISAKRELNTEFLLVNKEVILNPVYIKR